MSIYKIKQYYEDILPNSAQFLAIEKKSLPTCIWANTLKITPDELALLLLEMGIPTEPIGWNSQAFRLSQFFSLGREWPYLTGLLQIQEEVSMLPVFLLSPQPGERILDLCAAPGNKTAQMAVMMKNRGTIIANDRNFPRLRALGQIIKRLGLINISVTNYDGIHFPKINDYYFDKILVDVPCSCEGTFRKGKEKLIEPDRERSLKMSRQQLALMCRAIQLCRPGGMIVYSTCTFAPEENEAVIDQLLKMYPHDLDVLPARLAGFQFSEGIREWHGTKYDDRVQNTMRIWPHQNDTGGFFIALLRKKEKIQTYSRKSIIQNDVNINDYLHELQLRFGIAAEIFSNFYYHRPTNRGFYLVNRDHDVPTGLKYDSIGLFFLKTRIQYPKLSSAAAMLLGHHSVRHLVVLDQEQMYLYKEKQDCILRDEQIHENMTLGYVMVVFNRHVVGMGIYFPPHQDNKHRLRSLFPLYLQ